MTEIQLELGQRERELEIEEGEREGEEGEEGEEGDGREGTGGEREIEMENLVFVSRIPRKQGNVEQ